MIEAHLQDAVAELAVLRNSEQKVKNLESKMEQVRRRELSLDAEINKIKMANYEDRFRDAQLTIEALREAISKQMTN